MTKIASVLLIMRKITFLLFIAGLFSLSVAYAQNKKNNRDTSRVSAPVVVPDTSRANLLIPVTVKDSGKNGGVQYLTLQQCIEYAMHNQPGLNIAIINIDVAKTTNAINLAGALPQVSASGDLTHFIAQNNGGQQGKGYANTFTPGVAVSQAIFNPALLYAHRAAPLYVKQAQQATDSTRIFLVTSVSKSFYNLLLNLEQINVLKEDTARLGKSVRDAYHQYKGGIVDETDYDEAQITLNNSMAQLKQANENVIPQYAALKKLMGFPSERQFNIVFDTLQMMKGIHIDTTVQLQYEKRIELQSLETTKALQGELINYYGYSFLPTASAFFNYNRTFQNNNYNNLLTSSYPTSTIGLSVSIPIFTGFARLNNLHKAKLQGQILDWNEKDLKFTIYAEYTTALANYKGNYYNLQLLQRNVALAKRTYFVVDLQYKQGIVPYLNVITAESNLITSEISYLNALFQVLSNKIDLEKAMGSVSY